PEEQPQGEPQPVGLGPGAGAGDVAGGAERDGRGRRGRRPAGDGRRPGAHRTPPRSQLKRKLTATAVAMNVTVATTLAADSAAVPASPCPEVHPPDQRAP